ncbi:MAG: YigZ family protein [Firmicutes bacterium]|uniref:YigZ family protein n=1 Tax=Candidatus Alloenteromonas pullistercoris TaxID=2840785 RepID=A0A9D9DEB1_9FIRM|nr:YigZ family protein [Candidatus Enteromonas pullistercoris]
MKEDGSLVICLPGKGESSLLGSNFFAFAGPLNDKDGLEPILLGLQQANRKAAHIPYAFRLEQEEGFSEDGEPSGSSGRAMLELLRSKGLFGYLAVVRYFGGRKLGVGNLRRMVIEASSAAIADATIKQVVHRERYTVSLDYAAYSSLLSLSGKLGFEAVTLSQGENAICQVIVDPVQREELLGRGYALEGGETVETLI